MTDWGEGEWVFVVLGTSDETIRISEIQVRP